MRKKILAELEALRREVADLRREVAELRLRAAETHIHYDHIVQPTYPTLPSPHWTIATKPSEPLKIWC